MSPEPEINITHNTCFMPPGSIRFSVKIRQAAAFAYRLWRMLAFAICQFASANWQSLWQMRRICQTQSTTGEKWC